MKTKLITISSTNTFALVAFGVLFLNIGCRQGSDQSHKAITTEKLEPYECGEISKLHTLGGIFLSSQPKPADFEQAKKGGIKTVVNLRHADEIKDFDEAEIVESHAMKYVHLPWNGPDELTDQIFDETRRLLNSGEKPLLLHCSSANRVGAVWIPWRVLDGGLTIEAAVSEARTIGLKSPDYESKARDYVKRKSAN